MYSKQRKLLHPKLQLLRLVRTVTLIVYLPVTSGSTAAGTAQPCYRHPYMEIVDGFRRSTIPGTKTDSWSLPCSSAISLFDAPFLSPLSSNTSSSSTLQPSALHPQQQQRRLDDAQQQQSDYKYDDDSVNHYYQKATSNDVEITYDEENNTVVTVGDDVIVFVEHEYTFYMYNCGMIFLCIMIGATMAGLLMGVMSLDPLLINVKARTAKSEVERQQAVTLLPFVQNKNLVLVSLLLVNCGTNEALPVFLDNLIENPLVTVLLSLTVVLVFGEILPSAYFTGRDQLASACKLVPILRFVIIITSPISYPLAKLMDYYFSPSAENSAMKRGEISAMVRIQYEQHLAWKRRHGDDTTNNQDKEINQIDTTRIALNPLDKGSCAIPPCTICEPADFYACVNPCQQRNCSSTMLANMPSFSNPKQDVDGDDIIKLEGVLSIKDKKVSRVYTPLNRVVSIMTDTTLDEAMIVQIYGYGYSRLPIMEYYDERDNAVGICGIILTKQLMLIGKEDRRRASCLTIYEPPCISPRGSLADALSMILSGKRKSSHMAIVCTHPDIATKALKNSKPIPSEAGVMGIITLENILEELLQEPILDEKDKRLNPESTRALWVIGKWKAFVARKCMHMNDDGNSVCNVEDTSFDYVKIDEI